jgi:glycosyltransferase involved in cell wall biosynthesis
LNPNISIITPSYNQGQFLEQTIDSVLSQNYQNLEYIIIDGGSTDNSVEIIKKYAKYLHYWVSEKDNGQSHAINKGLQHATGEVFNWLNSDDYYLPDALKIVGDHFSDPNLNVLCAKSQIIKNGEVVKISLGTDVYPNNLAKTIGWARIDQPETFFRKSCLDKIGGVNDHFHYVMDKELWMRYLFQFSLDDVKRVDNQLVAFRLHETSKTSTRQLDFESETNALFYQIAIDLDMVSLAEEIALEGLPKQILISNFNNSDIKLLYQSLHYFLLYKYQRNYAENKFVEAKSFASILDLGVYSQKDLAEYKKISHRIQYPVAFKKLVNWLGSLSK